MNTEHQKVLLFPSIANPEEYFTDFADQCIGSCDELPTDLPQITGKSNIAIQLFIINDNSANQKQIYNNYLAPYYHGIESIDLKELVQNLKNDGVITYENPEISYYNYDLDMFVNCGFEKQMESDAIIPPSGILDDMGIAKKVSIRVHQKIEIFELSIQQMVQLSQQFGLDNPVLQSMNNDTESSTDTDNQLQKQQNQFSQQTFQQTSQQMIQEQQFQTPIKKESTSPEEKDFTFNMKRQKASERKVSDVMLLLAKWRHCYRNKGMGLEEGAEYLQVPRKSLDDYLRIVRHAKRGGFDFQSHMNERFGCVRSFVRNFKKGSKNSDATITDNQIDNMLIAGLQMNNNSRKITKSYC